MSAASDVGVMPIHLEFSLRYLIQRSGEAAPRADHRLDGFENAIAVLARRWRSPRPISPARELRMADETRDALVAWVEGDGAHAEVAARAIERLGVYASGAVSDESVPEGWVRINLDERAGAR